MKKEQTLETKKNKEGTTGELRDYQERTFEDIKHVDEYGNEYWEARELQQILGYKEWRLFSAVIEKAQIACGGSCKSIISHFGVYSKIVHAGVTTKNIIDYKLSRYACYCAPRIII